MSRKKWSEMTAAEKRVAVAKDVLKQLEAKKLKAVTGDYLYYDRDRFEDYSIKELSKDKKKPCAVCALGGLFYSYALREDSNLEARWNRDLLEDIFSSDQLEIIESAFEREAFGLLDEGLRAARCYDNVGSPKVRMKKIMQNIIDNDGEFVCP